MLDLVKLRQRNSSSIEKLCELIDYLSYDEVAPQLGVTSKYLRNLHYFIKKGEIERLKEKYFNKIEELYDFYITQSKYLKNIIDFLHNHLDFHLKEIASFLNINYQLFCRIKDTKIWSKKYIENAQKIINGNMDEDFLSFLEKIKDTNFAEWGKEFLIISKIFNDLKTLCLEYKLLVEKGEKTKITKTTKQLLDKMFEISCTIAKAINVSFFTTYKYLERLSLQFFLERNLDVLAKFFYRASKSNFSFQIKQLRNASKISGLSYILEPEKSEILKELPRVIVYVDYIISAGNDFFNILNNSHKNLKQSLNFDTSKDLQEVTPVASAVIKQNSITT